MEQNDTGLVQSIIPNFRCGDWVKQNNRSSGRDLNLEAPEDVTGDNQSAVTSRSCL
jgi:hypothetical protein